MQASTIVSSHLQKAFNSNIMATFTYLLEWREVKALTFKKEAENFNNIWIVFFFG